MSLDVALNPPSTSVHVHVLYFEKKVDRRNLTMQEIKQ